MFEHPWYHLFDAESTRNDATLRPVEWGDRPIVRQITVGTGDKFVTRCTENGFDRGRGCCYFTLRAAFRKTERANKPDN